MFKRLFLLTVFSIIFATTSQAQVPGWNPGWEFNFFNVEPNGEGPNYKVELKWRIKKGAVGPLLEFEIGQVSMTGFKKNGQIIREIPGLTASGLFKVTSTQDILPMEIKGTQLRVDAEYVVNYKGDRVNGKTRSLAKSGIGNKQDLDLLAPNFKASNKYWYQEARILEMKVVSVSFGGALDVKALVNKINQKVSSSSSSGSASQTSGFVSTNNKRTAEQVHADHVRRVNQNQAQRSQSRVSSVSNTSYNEPVRTEKTRAEIDRERAQLAKMQHEQFMANLEAQDRATQQVLDGWNSYWDQQSRQMQNAWASEQNFKSRKSQLTRLDANSGQQLISEFRRKSSELDRLYVQRQKETMSQLQKQYANLERQAENQAQAQFAKALGSIHVISAQKQLNKERAAAKKKLEREKDQKFKELSTQLQYRYSSIKTDALRSAALAVAKPEEDFYLKLYQYADCVYNSASSVVRGSDPCSKPYGSPSSQSSYSALDYYNAYSRKKASSFSQVKREANYFLGMALKISPDNEAWLYEKAMLSSTPLRERLSLLKKAQYLTSDQVKYKSVIESTAKNLRGAEGEEGGYLNGNKHGLWHLYWTDGSLQQVVEYNNGNILGQKRLFLDNDLKVTRDRNSYEYYRVLMYDDNGTWINSVRDYYKDGTLKLVAKYVSEKAASIDIQAINNLVDGSGFQSYYDNGQLREDILIGPNGNPGGPSIFYHKNGRMKWHYEHYSDGRLKEVYGRWDEAGNPEEIGSLKDGNGSFIAYNEDATVIERQVVKNGVVVGVSQLMNDGTIAYTEADDKGVGKFTYVYADNAMTKVLKEAIWYNGQAKHVIYYDNSGNITTFAGLNADKQPELRFEVNQQGTDQRVYQSFKITRHPNGLVKVLTGYYEEQRKRTFNVFVNPVTKKEIRVKDYYTEFLFDETGTLKVITYYNLKNGKLIARFR